MKSFKNSTLATSFAALAMSAQAVWAAETAEQDAAAPNPALQKIEEMQRKLDMKLRPHKALGEAICAAFADGKKYIFLGDSNHGEKSLRAAVFSRENLQAVAQCSPDAALVLEGPPGTEQRLQEAATEWLDTIGAPGAGNPQDAVKRYMMTQVMGVSPRYYDPGYAFSEEDRKVVSVLASAYTRPECMAVSMLYNVQARAQDPQKFWVDLKRILDTRLANDNDDIAAAITSRHPDGAVVFYGSGHMNRLNDLDEMSGAQQSMWIEMEESQTAPRLHEGMKLRKLYSGSPEDDRPDYIYFTAEQRLVPLAEIDPDFYDRTERLSREGFSACQTDLPADVRGAFTNTGGPDFTYEDFRVLQDPDAPLPAIIKHWAP